MAVSNGDPVSKLGTELPTGIHLMLWASAEWHESRKKNQRKNMRGKNLKWIKQKEKKWEEYIKDKQMMYIIYLPFIYIYIYIKYILYMHINT